MPDAESALREVESRPFDVAVVDLNLPGLSGEDLVSELRDRRITSYNVCYTKLLRDY